MDREVVNFSEVTAKRNIMAYVSRLEGPHRVTIAPARPGITNPQRGYYFGVIVYYFADFMIEHNPELTRKQASEAAHLELKRRFLPNPIVDQHGQVIADAADSLTKIDKPTMQKFIDNCIH